MDPPAKGTVTPLSSLFSPEEARKAASYVEEKIGEKREELNRLQQFVDENANLINLLKKLPDQLHHDVMVPFGKMAFFPGRLIHTNECLVLLGENYYTERTSKQAIEVLKRRDKTLQSQIHSLKAEIEDFQAEASFFTSTASEAAEGLVEIREEYVEEEDSSATLLQSGVKEPSGLPGGETAEEELGDDEFARIMSRLNELEMEEEQEGVDGDDRGEVHDSPTESKEETEHDMVKGIEYREQETTISAPKEASSRSSFISEPRHSEPRVRAKVIEVSPEKHPHTDLDDPLKCIGRKLQNLHEEDQSRGGIPKKKTVTWGDLPATSSVSRAKAKIDVVGPQKIESHMQEQEPEFDSTKAFTGSIVEHSHNLETNTQGQGQGQIGQMQSSVSRPSRPVSRFKAQRK